MPPYWSVLQDSHKDLEQLICHLLIKLNGIFNVKKVLWMRQLSASSEGYSRMQTDSQYS